MVWRVFWCVWFRVLKFMNHISNVARHGKVDPTFVVIPMQAEATVDSTGPISGHRIVFFQYKLEMQHISFVGVFHTEIVYYQGKGEWPTDVSP